MSTVAAVTSEGGETGGGLNMSARLRLSPCTCLNSFRPRTPTLPHSHTPTLPHSHTPILPHSHTPHSTLPLSHSPTLPHSNTLWALAAGTPGTWPSCREGRDWAATARGRTCILDRAGEHFGPRRWRGGCGRQLCVSSSGHGRACQLWGREHAC